LGTEKFHLKGVTYGPFAPDPTGCTFASPEQTRCDLALIRELGANTVRTYYVPPRWFLDAALEQQVRVFVDVPWPKHLCFLDDPPRRREARETVRAAARACRNHPALLAYSVVNEIPPDIVRWSGVTRIERFISELVAVAQQEDPGGLCTFTCYPPTEFLRVPACDFLCFNVYLHHPGTFEVYLSRLQSLAGSRPLVLGEFGMDSIRNGESEQAQFLSWQIESACRRGVAGSVLFSFTDDWYRGGMQIQDWAFGVTRRHREPKPAFAAVQRQYRQAPCLPLSRAPRVSVVVASYNGGKTLRTCLTSLQQLRYPDYEVILVDDGSTDDTPEIARVFPAVRCIRQENRGLSAARNAGVAAATGDLVAFTDSDCRVDEHWLYYMVNDLLRGDYAAMGGHNFLPPDDSPVAAAVMASPGGPAHVMLTDEEAEHIPGCNMLFHKWALEEIGGFDPVFRKAGDDVDVCWRLLERGRRIGFCHAGFVWHYRRSTIRAYLRQQRGYGEAEALLARKHPEYFSPLGGSIWRGRIYSDNRGGVILRRPVIYHGVFASGFFQKLYQPPVSLALMLCTSLEYHVFITFPLLLLALLVPLLWALPAASLLLSLGVCTLAAVQADVPADRNRFWTRPLIALLHALQPLERGLARYRTGLRRRDTSGPGVKALRLPPIGVPKSGEVLYWSDGRVDRFQLLGALKPQLEEAGWLYREDTGWETFDLEIQTDPWTQVRLVTVHEDLELGRRNIRCRFRTAWTARLTLAFWGLVTGMLLVLRSFAGTWPWAWMLLLALPLLLLVLEHREYHAAAHVHALVKRLADSLGLVSVNAKS
jgi:glycosyltransferase involved in cell wall biosynthesis